MARNARPVYVAKLAECPWVCPCPKAVRAIARLRPPWRLRGLPSIRDQPPEQLHVVRPAPIPAPINIDLVTLEWVDGSNHHRLLEPIGSIPPVEAEANYYAQRGVLDMVA